MTHRVCPGNTIRWLAFAATLGGLALRAQTPGNAPAPAVNTLDWRRIGNAAVLRPGGDLATGSIDRVWYAPEGLAVRTTAGRVWLTSDFESWTPASLTPPVRLPEVGSVVRYRLAAGQPAGQPDVWRSEDGGVTWSNRTGTRQGSILPGPLVDLAIHPSNPDELTVAGAGGVWRTLDGGETWAGLNDELPALPVERILTVPGGSAALRVSAGTSVFEWHPGQRLGWLRSSDWRTPAVESNAAGDYIYLGSRDGQILVQQGGRTQAPFQAGGAVTRFWLDPRDPARALAIAGGKLLRTFNGGAYWDDVTGSLAGDAITAVSADSESGYIYAGRADGLYAASWDVTLPGPAPGWVQIPGPAPGAIRDLRLDAGGHQLFAAIEGWGVYSTIAPHRRKRPAVVGAADLAARAAAPGGLVSVLGPALTAARSGGRAVPVLSSAAGESQLQLPFDLTGNLLDLRLESEAGLWNLAVPLQSAAPAVVADRDGSPLLLDADSGVLLDALHPIRPGMRLQILATGLGKVRPAWPLATPAPAGNPPAVEASVGVRLDGQPLTVLRATLAPGYIGFYLIEAEVPLALNAGTAELVISAGSAASSAVRVYIEP